jgi:poly(A) polymerase
MLQKKSHEIKALAKDICKTLFDEGYTAYFAGGWVRDLLMGKETDEIDIATSAPPVVIQSLFPKTFPVGIAFGVIIVVVDGINFEVTTFRKDHAYCDGRHPEGVDFSTPKNDAQRRDFTINGMFYDPLSETVYDYVHGQEDLKKKIIRAIGNPAERFAEDRLRMVRSVRFAARLGFHISEETEAAIRAYAPSLFPSVSMERIWQELCKMAAHPHFDQALLMLHTYGLLQVIFPHLPLSKKELESRVAAFPYFPLKAPAIVYILELFTNLALEQKLALGVYLKTSLQERKIVEFFTAAHTFFKQLTIESVDWAHFYAHPLSELFLEVEAAKILPPQRAYFVSEHEKRQKSLEKHIARIKKKAPLVTSKHLHELGIAPGKQMGTLLKMAERIAINEDLHEPESVLKQLKLD